MIKNVLIGFVAAALFFFGWLFGFKTGDGE